MDNENHIEFYSYWIILLIFLLLFIIKFTYSQDKDYLDTVIKRINDSQKQDVRVIVEQVSAMPGQGVTSMFNFGQSYGILKGIYDYFLWNYVDVWGFCEDAIRVFNGSLRILFGF